MTWRWFAAQLVSETDDITVDAVAGKLRALHEARVRGPSSPLPTRSRPEATASPLGVR